MTKKATKPKKTTRGSTKVSVRGRTMNITFGTSAEDQRDAATLMGGFALKARSDNEPKEDK